jgi:anti-anti-sigma regulatory factor
MGRLLKPGVFLLNNLRYPQKFALLNALLVLPLILAIGLLFSETYPRIAFTQREILGAAYVRRMINLYTMLTASQRQVYAARPEQLNAIQQLIAAEVDDIGQEPAFAPLDIAEPIALLRSKTDDLGAAISRGDPTQIGQAHLTIYSQLRDEIRRVGDSSNLILDPELNTYYLMDTAIVQIPSRLVLIAQIQDLLDTQMLQPEQADFARLFELNGQIAANLTQSSSTIDRVLQSDPTMRNVLNDTLLTNTESMQSLVAILRTLDTDTSLLPMAEQQSIESFDTSLDLWHTTLVGLEERLQRRIDRLMQKNLAALGVTAIMLLCSIYLLVAFYRSTMNAVQILDRASKNLTNGGGAIQLDTRDELGQVVTSFNRVTAALVAENAARQRAELERTQLQEETIRAQAVSLDDLMVPIIPLQHDLLLLPLIGAIDTRRAQQIIETLLRGVVAHRAHRVILDMTGVRVVDTQVARAILDAAQGVRLLGAEIVLAGLRAEVAHTIVQLGIDLDQITFYASLQDAIASEQSLNP